MSNNSQLNANESTLGDQVRQIIADIAGLDRSQFHDESDIREDLTIDSLRLMEIVAAVEQGYGIRLDEARLFDIATVGEFLDLLQEEMHAKAP